MLVVDDDDASRYAVEKLLRLEGFAVAKASNGAAALAEAARARPDVVLTDLQMAPMDGLELCKRLHEIDPGLPVIVMTAHSDMDSVIHSLRERAEDFLIKPLQYDSVIWCIERALARRAAEREREEIQRMLNERLVLSSMREREHAEEQAHHRAEIQALLENLREGVIVAESSGRVVMINDAARTIMGYGAEGQNLDSIVRSLELHDLAGQPLGNDRPLRRALLGEQFKEYEVVLVTPSGERRNVVTTGTSVKDDSGRVSLAFLMFRDVTELRRLERQREEYLALISHDLRGPLSSLLMCLNLLKSSLREDGQPKLTRAERGDLVERAERNVNRMNTMLDELRQTTSLEAKGIELACAPCDLQVLAANVVERIDDPRAPRVTIETSDAASLSVLADAPQLERVVENLLTNALKYSPEDAPVILKLAREESTVEIAVIDRGIGIAPETEKKLFDRYYRTAGGKARAQGLGLGLYIARLIAELHGGRIEVASELGKGSTFRLRLPAL